MGKRRRFSKKTREWLVNSFLVEWENYPGSEILTSDTDVIITNALGHRLSIINTGYTVEVIRGMDTPGQVNVGHLSNRKALAFGSGQWQQWAKFVWAGHCSGIPRERIIQALTRQKDAAAQAERFVDAAHLLKQIRALTKQDIQIPEHALLSEIRACHDTILGNLACAVKVASATSPTQDNFEPWAEQTLRQLQDLVGACQQNLSILKTLKRVHDGKVHA